MSSNYPPGVTEDMIPGNRPEDLEWDNIWDWLETVDIEPDEFVTAILSWCVVHGRKFDKDHPCVKKLV